MKDKNTASLLAFFFGGLGAHHFYLGNIGRGFLYLVFAITFIPSIVALVEGFMLLSMDQNVFDNKYNAAYIDYSAFDKHRLKNVQKLSELKAQGAITEEEFEREKKKYIA